MNENNIDKLFREKLQGHTTTPSPAAWEQLNSQLKQKKGKKKTYYWAAAAITLLALTSGWLLLNQAETDIPKTTVAQAETAKEQAEVIIPETSASIASSAEVTTGKSGVEATPPIQTDITSPVKSTKQVASYAKPSTQAPPHGANNPVPVKSIPVEEKASALAQVENSPETIKTITTPSLPTELGNPKANALAVAEPEKIIIEYKPTVQTAVASQAVIQNSPASSPEEEKNEPTVLRVLEDVKSGKIGLADIRSAKNNLFARITKP
jgi:hypothetical protein